MTPREPRHPDAGRRPLVFVLLAITAGLLLVTACILPAQRPDTDDDDDDATAGDDDDTTPADDDDDTTPVDDDDDTTPTDDDDDTTPADDDDDTTTSPCSVGEALHEGCGQIAFEGCCNDEMLLWCENNWICRLDCTASPSCGWNADAAFYDCGTDGEPAPNNTPPLECP